MLDQQVRFGNSDDKLKVTGSYKAESKLSVNEYSLVSSFLKVNIRYLNLTLLTSIATNNYNRSFGPYILLYRRIILLHSFKRGTLTNSRLNRVLLCLDMKGLSLLDDEYFISKSYR